MDKAWSRFVSRCQPEPNGCIRWLGEITRYGYGRFHVAGRGVRAHRYSFEHFKGPIPQGLALDHLCRNRWCVNHEHLEAVTPAENLRRSAIAPATINAAKTHCPKGHEYTPENTMPRSLGRKRWRECRECGRQETRRYLARKRLERRAQ
jgi:hypothetical protein